jgi:hypothetical protein
MAVKRDLQPVPGNRNDEKETFDSTFENHDLDSLGGLNHCHDLLRERRFSAYFAESRLPQDFWPFALRWSSGGDADAQERRRDARPLEIRAPVVLAEERLELFRELRRAAASVTTTWIRGRPRAWSSGSALSRSTG